MTLAEKIKALFNEASPEVAEASFMDVKSKDGSLLLRISALETDGSIELINEDGSLTPFDGVVALEDGSEITAVEGKITEVKAAEAEEETEVETPAAEFAEGDITPDGEAPASEEIASNLEERVTALESRISEIISMLKDKETKVEEMSAENKILKDKNE